MSMVEELIKAGNIFWKKRNEDKFSRFISWEDVYMAFYKMKDKDLTEEEIDYLSLQLSLYLASWGMYRGSTFLINKNYRINIAIVKLIHDFQKNNDEVINLLNEGKLNKEDLNNLDEFWESLKKLIDKIEEEYENGQINKNVSNTLITKILMGTLGITPAYDNEFRNTIKYLKNQRICNIPSYFKRKNFINSLKKCYEFYLDNKEFEKLRKKIKLYPRMKILDMCFWQYSISKEE